MSRELWMQCFHYLKAGLKRIDFKGVILCIFFFLLLSDLSSVERNANRYVIDGDRSLILVSRPESIPEKVIRSNVESGYKSEIYTSFRIQMSGSPLSIGGEHLEIHIRKTGFRDRITGDYILLLNDHEIGVFRNWDDFFRAFSSDLVYPSGILVEKNLLPTVKVRVRVIYKKLVSPFSILYLLPGKFVDTGRWQDVHPGDLP